MENGGAQIRRQTAQFKFLERGCWDRRDAVPTCEGAGHGFSHFADLTIRFVVLELIGKQFQRVLVEPVVAR